MNLFEDETSPTSVTAYQMAVRHLMAELFLNTVVASQVASEDTIEDGDGEEVVIPDRAFSD